MKGGSSHLQAATRFILVALSAGLFNNWDRNSTEAQVIILLKFEMHIKQSRINQNYDSFKVLKFLVCVYRHHFCYLPSGNLWYHCRATSAWFTFCGFLYSIVCSARRLLDQFQFFLQSFTHREITGKTDVDPLGNGDRDTNSHLCSRYLMGCLLMLNIESSCHWGLSCADLFLLDLI